MGDFFCIYSGKMWPEDQRTKEHIVPFALGGSDDFVTNDVAKEPNHEMGARADADLIHHYAMSWERCSQGIASDKGRIPQFVRKAKAIVDGIERNATFVINSDGTHAVDIHPRVVTNWKAGTFEFTCAPEQVAEIVASIEEKGRRKGMVFSLNESNGSRREISLSELKLIENFSLDREDMFRGILKIALGTGHWLLGDEWSRSIHADLLREAVWSPRPWDGTRYSALSRIWPANGYSLQGVKDQLYVGKGFHVIMVMHHGPLSCFVLLFGQYEGLIPLAPEYGGSAALPPGFREILVLDVRTRRLWRFSQEDFIWKRRQKKLPFDAEYRE